MLSLLVTALALLPAARVSTELPLPANDGWVTDLAGLLTSDQERALEELMESYRSGSGHEVALLTIPSLEGDVLEQFSLRVAEAWGVGDAEKDEGVLFLVSRNDRRMRIEVGYGMEGRLPDAICGRILDNVVAPQFRKGDWFGGIRAGIQAIHSAAGGDYGPIQRSAGGRRRSVGAFALLPLLLFLLLLASTARRRRGAGGSWVLPMLMMGSMGHRSGGGGFGSGGGFGGGGFGGFGGGGGGGFGGGGASGGW